MNVKRHSRLLNDEPGVDGGGAAVAAPAPAPAASPAPAAAPASAAPAPAPAAAAPAAAPAAAGETKPEPSANGEWPADWRARIAGNDDKLIKQLEKFASPKALADSYNALQRKMSSGELKAPLPKDASPEQVAEWRKANGIPEAPDKYEIKLDSGMVIGEADKPAVDAVIAAMHAENATPSQVNAAVATFFKWREGEAQRLQEQDVAHKTETEDALHQEWGGEYRVNVNVARSFLESAPAGVGEKLMGARMPDGRALANDPAVLNWIVSMARELNPVASVAPGSNDPTRAMSDEIANIESMMGDRNSDYWRGPKSEGLQKRYRELLTAREKYEARK